ncbi:MAG: protein kinase domain-containing protein [Planctomycetota bacterium]
MPKLVVLSGADVKEVAIKGELTIGRSASNGLPLTQEDNASRNHAKIVVKNQKATLVDLDSSNGTRINGMKIKEKELVHGDTIVIGKSQLIFQEDEKDNREGTVIAGYKLTHKLGEGGMGTVFRATQLSMDRSVALKILKKELCDSREFVKGFLREARLAGQLNHAGIIQVHEVSQYNGVIYFSMEFVEGKTAQELIEKEGKVPLGQALDIVIAVADALAYADSKGIIHRDIKPANIIVTKNNEYKLADLGLAGGNRAIGKESKRSARVMGTPNYIAPEQSENKELDIRADIYALGATFFHLLTGHPPFQGANALAIITMHHTEPRPLVRKEVPSVPKSVEAVIERMMAVDKKDRPANAKDLLDELKEIRAKEQTAIRKSLGKTTEQEAIPTAATVLTAATTKAVPNEESRPPAEESSKKASNVSRRMAKETGGTRGKTMTAIHKPAGGGVLNSILSLLVVLAVLAVATAITLYLMPEDNVEKLFPHSWADQQRKAQDVYANKVRDAQAWNAEQRKRADDWRAQQLAAQSNPTPNDTPSDNPPPKPEDNQATPPPKQTAPGLNDKTPAEILIATNEVCAAAQQKLNQDDYISARRLLVEHLDKYGDIGQTRLATKLLADVNDHINIFLDNCLQNVQSKSAVNDFAAATYWGSKAIAMDPQAKDSLEIQVILGNNDILMQTPCEDAKRAARDRIDQGDFAGAEQILSKVLAKANGTSWTSELRSMHLETLYGDRIAKKLNKVLADAFKNEAPIVMTTRGTDVGYSVSRLSGFKVNCTDGGAIKVATFSDDSLRSWISKIPSADPIDHLALGIFMNLAGVPSIANEEIQKAARDRDTASDAIAYETSHHMIANFRYYDFTDWKQQLDWQVQAGSWAFQNQRFECLSADIGEADLNPKFAVSAKHLALSWSASARSDHSGFVVDVYQDSTHRIAVRVEGNKAHLELQVGDQTKNAEAPLTVAKDKSVEFALEINGDDAVVTLPGTHQRLEATLAGAGAIHGKLRIQILEGTAAFGDILIQN